MGWKFQIEDSGRSFWLYTGRPDDYTLSPGQGGHALQGTEQDKFSWDVTTATTSPVLADDDGGAFDIGYTATPAGIAPEDQFHIGAAAFRGGYAAANYLPKMGAVGGRLLVYYRGRLKCTIKCAVSGRDQVTWLLRNVNHYARGYDVRYLSSEPDGETFGLDTWLPDLIEDFIWDANDFASDATLGVSADRWEVEDEWLSAFGGDGFDWNSPRDWAEAGLRTFGFMGGVLPQGR